MEVCVPRGHGAVGRFGTAFNARFADGTYVFAAAECNGTRYNLSLVSGPGPSWFRYWIYSYATGYWSAPSNWTYVYGLPGLNQIPWNLGPGTVAFYGQFAHAVGGSWQYAEGFMGEITWRGGTGAGNSFCLQTL